MLRFRFCSILVVSASLAVAGCTGGSKGDHPPTVPVTVTVTMGGKPVEGATVTFIDESATYPAVGRTDAQGVTKLTSFEQGDGAVVGTYKVAIDKSEYTGQKTADDSSPDYVPPDANTPPPVLKRHTPAKYSVPGTTPLTATVKDGEPNDIKFDLTP